VHNVHVCLQPITQHHILCMWTPGALSPLSNRTGDKLTTHLHLVLKLGTCGTINTHVHCPVLRLRPNKSVDF
jgi:hypothetical protein